MEKKQKPNSERLAQLIRKIELQEGNKATVTLTKANREKLLLARSLDELTVSQQFLVENVVCRNYLQKVELNDDDAYHKVDSGYFLTVQLDVTSLSAGLNIVKELLFLGDTIAQKGHIISAQIPIFNEETIRYESKHFKSNSFKYDREKKIYVDRPVRTKEKAIEISIISSENGQVLRTDRAIDYDNYQKKTAKKMIVP